MSYVHINVYTRLFYFSKGLTVAEYFRDEEGQDGESDALEMCPRKEDSNKGSAPLYRQYFQVRQIFFPS